VKNFSTLFSLLVARETKIGLKFGGFIGGFLKVDLFSVKWEEAMDLTRITQTGDVLLQYEEGLSAYSGRFREGLWWAMVPSHLPVIQNPSHLR